MKNEELFDIISDLKLSDEYIEEALTGGTEKYGAKVYAEKSRVSPRRIIAPVAACLAVFAAAGILFANRDKLPIRNNGGAAESTESDDTGYHALWYFPSQKTELVEKCQNVVMNTYAQALQGDVTWQIYDMNIDYDDTNELLLCPRINGKSVKGVGVCVFKRYTEEDADFIGSFGSEFDSINLDNIYLSHSLDTETSYYFNSFEEYGKCTDSIQKLYVNNGIVCEENYLRLVKTYPNSASDKPYTETAYCCGKVISTDELLKEWNNVLKLDNQYPMSLPIPNNSSESHLGMSESVQLLINKYNVPETSVNSLHRSIKYIDLNNDGTNETVIEFRNCEYLRGIYVFSSDGRLIGEFDLEGERGQDWGIGNMDSISKRLSTSLFPHIENGEKHYFYRTSRTGSAPYGLEGRSEWAEGEIYKIVANENGTLSAEKALEYSYEDYMDGNARFIINGKEVSEEEFRDEERKYEKYSYPYSSEQFIW